MPDRAGSDIPAGGRLTHGFASLTGPQRRARGVMFLRRLMQECLDDDIFGLAAEMAYWLGFSLFPFFIFLATIAGIVARIFGPQNVLDNAMAYLYVAVDYETAQAIRKPLSQVLGPTSGALSIGAILSAILSFNTAASAIAAAMKACNRAYGIRETRSFLYQRAMAFGSTLLLAVSLVGGTLLLSIGGHIVRLFNFGLSTSVAFSMLRYGGGLVGIILGFALFYWLSPNLRQPFRWVFPGVAVATLGLIVFTLLFGLYLRLFAEATFNKTFGTLGGIILFFFFLRLASIIVLVGAEINAEIARELGLLAPIVREQHVEPESRFRNIADRINELRERHRSRLDDAER